MQRGRVSERNVEVRCTKLQQGVVYRFFVNCTISRRSALHILVEKSRFLVIFCPIYQGREPFYAILRRVQCAIADLTHSGQLRCYSDATPDGIRNAKNSSNSIKIADFNTFLTKIWTAPIKKKKSFSFLSGALQIWSKMC